MSHRASRLHVSWHIASVAAAGTLACLALAASPGRGAAPEWRSTADMLEARMHHAAEALPDGSILVVGGDMFTSSTPMVSCEIRDPDTEQWRTCAPLTVQRRVYNGSVSLTDGRVLVAGGGLILPDGRWQPFRATEVYDPRRDTWDRVGDLVTARRDTALVVLADGRVLAAGGSVTFIPDRQRFTTKTELFDPSTGTWRAIASPLAVARDFPQAILLDDGRVLLTGGESSQGPGLAVTELFDPATERWTTTGTMHTGRYLHAVVRMMDGRVLAAGGAGPSNKGTASAEIYDPATGEWSGAAPMLQVRASFKLVLLADGRVLAVGGTGDQTGHWTEAYDPSNDAWRPFAAMREGDRRAHAVTVASDGSVIATGGYSGDGFTGVVASVDILEGALAWRTGMPKPPPSPPAPTATAGPSPTAMADHADNCAEAQTVEPGRPVTADIGDTDDVDVFRLEVPEPFTQVQIEVEPDRDLELFVTRGCGSAGVGSGRHIGVGSGRHIGGRLRITLDTLMQTGTYYVSVQARATASRLPLPYRLLVAMQPIDATAQRAIILTHRPALEIHFPDDPALELLDRRLEVLAEAVAGVLVTDLTALSDEELRDAYLAWLAGDDSPTAANRVALALADWIRRQRVSLPHMRYVVLVGDDRVIPHYRLRVRPPPLPDPNWRFEQEYVSDSGIAADSAVGQALLADMTLTDDLYAGGAPIRWQRQQYVLVPELAVGRLVETPTEIEAAVGQFLAEDGVVTVERSLAAGWDFMADGIEAVDTVLAEAGLDANRRVLYAGNNWSAQQLNELLGVGRLELLAFGVHASHAIYETPAGDTVRAEAVAQGMKDLRGTLCLAMACHAGLGVPDRGPDNQAELDFAQAWLGRGASYISNLSWAYGMHRHVGYQEELLARTAAALLDGGGAAVGDALVAAKREYYLSHDMNSYHAKTLVGTGLYGLPMVRYSIAPTPNAAAAGEGVRQPRTSRQDPTTPEAVPSGGRPLVPSSSILDTQQGGEGRVISATIALHLPDPAELRTFTDEASGGSYQILEGHAPYAEADRAIQPMLRWRRGEMLLDGASLAPRAVVLRGATYVERVADPPLVARVGALAVGSAPQARSTRPAIAQADAARATWMPPLPVALLTLQGSPGLVGLLEGEQSGQLLVYLGRFRLDCDRQRMLVGDLVIDEYYSDSQDRQLPAISLVTLEASESGIAARVVASDASRIARVVLGCDDNAGHWVSAELMPQTDGTWRGPVPAGAACAVQVLDWAGNISIDDNDGLLHSVGDDSGRFSVWLPIAWRHGSVHHTR